MGFIFGFIYLVVNAGAQKPFVAVLIRILAVLAFLIGMILIRKYPYNEFASVEGSMQPFGKKYALIVVVEAALLLAGVIACSSIFHNQTLIVTWISLIVGIHFIFLANVWHLAAIRILGLTIALCGVAGYVALELHASRALVTLIAGILPGVSLFVFSYYSLVGNIKQLHS
jgi:hypothetical protein